jgi:photosystem II stability/assembly factor-like uncharacterized protein
MPGDANRVVAATHSGAFLTTTAGETWNDLRAASRLRAVGVHPCGSDTIAVAGDQGVMISHDAGQTWTSLNQGLETLAVTSLSFFGMGATQLIAGTAGRGCFVWSFASGAAEGNKPQATSLKPQATILRAQLTLPASGWMRDASCVLLDNAGREVLKLHPGGNDVSRLAPGVYFVQLSENGQRSAARKVVIQK